jgi:hypothetical protein
MAARLTSRATLLQEMPLQRFVVRTQRQQTFLLLELCLVRFALRFRRRHHARACTLAQLVAKSSTAAAVRPAAGPPAATTVPAFDPQGAARTPVSSEVGWLAATLAPSRLSDRVALRRTFTKSRAASAPLSCRGATGPKRTALFRYSSRDRCPRTAPRSCALTVTPQLPVTGGTLEAQASIKESDILVRCS